MGDHDFKNNKVPPFPRKPGNINVLMLCMLSRNWLLCQQSVINAMLSHSLLPVPSFIRIKRNLDGDS